MSADPLDELDYYTLLRVEDRASADAIRAAFHDFARRYHPDRFATAPAAKRERAAQIYRRGAEAYRILMDAGARRQYDQALANGELRIASDAGRSSRRPPPPSGPSPSVISARARPFATRAAQALKAGDYKTARLNLKMALSHEPENEALKARLEDVEDKLRAG